MRKKNVIGKVMLFTLFFISLAFNSCQDDVNEKFTTQESVQVSTYLDMYPDVYSEFKQLVEAAGMYDLLNAYGVYTCFFPNNEAVLKYYEEKGTSFDQLSDSLKKEIVQSHIISGRVETTPIESINFPIGSISVPNMNNYFLRIATTGSNRFTVNGEANIIKWDEKVHNGVIHTVDKVLEVPKFEIKEVLEPLTDFSLFYQALEITGMIDSLYLTDNKDYVYQGKKVDQKASGTRALMETPAICKYGYTVLMESNSVFAKAGITTLDELKNYAENVYYELFPLTENAEEQDRIRKDFTDRNNALNRFVSYHLTNRMIDINEFIKADWEPYFVQGTVLREYIEMMMPYSLIEIQQGNRVNKDMYFQGTREEEIETTVQITKNVADVGGTIMFHEINNILTYKGVETNVLNKRLRIDVASMAPELITNKLRGDFTGYIIPPNFFKNINYSEVTQFQYIGSSGWPNMYGDEFLFAGKYDFSIVMPPIPPGRWEIRLCYTANPKRGVAQIFWDGKPCGIPLDMRMNATHVNIGWVADANTSDNGIENDKMMRNRGYMKGPSTVLRINPLLALRDNDQSLRRIIAVEEYTESRPHTLRIKSVEDVTTPEFHIDFMEFVPSTYLEQEGRD